ncbi:hypothetical protein OF83DRAFT_1179637, partial [Amylostereum chailletii]
MNSADDHDSAILQELLQYLALTCEDEEGDTADAAPPHTPVTHKPSTILGPISHLPVETLQYIFSLVLDAVLFESNRSHHPALRTILSVCHHWRCVAQAYPALWTHIPVRCAGWASVALKLSKAMPLSIAAHTGRMHAVQRAIARLSGHMHRVRTLALPLGSSLQLLDMSALEELTLHRPEHESESLNEDEDDGEDTHGFLTAAFPNLHTLRLIRIRAFPASLNALALRAPLTVLDIVNP